MKTWKCTTCGAISEVDMLLGSPVLHRVPGGHMICRSSGERLFWPRVTDDDGNPVLRGVSRERQTRKSDPMPAPTWFPTWGDRTMPPTLTLPAKHPMGVWLPNKSFSEQSATVQINLESAGYVEWDPAQECFSVSNRNLIRLANNLLRRFPLVAVGREYNSEERCTASCQNAKGHLCTCSCQALHHGKGKWMSGWQITERQTSQVGGKEWSWLLVRQG